MGDLNAALVPQNLRGTEAATFAQLSQILRYPRICGALRSRGARRAKGLVTPGRHPLTRT